MEYDVYCDESRPDLLSSRHPQAAYMVIGSLWLRTEDRGPFKDGIHDLRDTHRIGGEFKWQKVSRSRLGFYRSLMDWFVDQGDELRFRCIAVEQDKVNLLKFHDDDQELGFYKFYYQMLHNWIMDSNTYCVFCDYKMNRRPERLTVLQRCLKYSNLSAEVASVQAVRSRESVLIQVADVLTGAASARLNGTLLSGSAKLQVVELLESRLGHTIRHTHRAESKFNVFVIDLMGGQ